MIIISRSELNDMKKKVIGTVVRDGICLDTDDELIFKALRNRAFQLERKLERGNMTPNQRAMTQDEYERTFALTDRFRRN